MQAEKLPALVLEDPSHHLKVRLGIVLEHIRIAEAAVVAEGPWAVQEEAPHLTATLGPHAAPAPCVPTALPVGLAVSVGPLLWRLPRGSSRRSLRLQRGLRHTLRCSLRRKSMLCLGQKALGDGGEFVHSHSLMACKQQQHADSLEFQRTV